MKRKNVKLLPAVCLMVLLLMCIFSIPVHAENTYVINGKQIKLSDFSWQGTSGCWAFANNVYKAIWGTNFDSTFTGSAAAGHNMLRDLSDSELTFTKEHLIAYVSEAPLGAVIRICDSSYLHGSDGWGHNVVIVQKDSNGFTTFENWSSGTVEKYWTWDSFYQNNSSNYTTGGSRYAYIKYIKWPNAPAYGGSTPTVTVSKNVKCLTRITIKASAPLYRSATTNAVTDPTWDKFKDETSIWAKGYVDLSNGERRYYFNAVSGGDNETHTYYVPTTSLNSIVPDHTYGEAATEHPHIQSCECGATKESTSTNCYTCYPAQVVYHIKYSAKIVSKDINYTALTDTYVRTYYQGTYPEYDLNLPNLEAINEDVTFIGWSTESDATTARFYGGMDISSLDFFKPGETLHLYAIWEKNNTHKHTFAAPRKAHPHWQMCECGIGETYYDSSCQLCTNSDAVSVVKSVICYSKITMLPHESLYTTPVPDGNSYTFGNQEMEIYADGYVILSTGEKRYFYNSDPKYYISEFSLSDVQVNHLFKETYEGSSLVHPHYMKCECGEVKTEPDTKCYACYPATIRFDINIPGVSEYYYIQKINAGRYGEPTINCSDPTREGYTFLGWALEKDAEKAIIDNGDIFYIKPGYNECTLYAVWQKDAHMHTLQHTQKTEATCEKSGNIEYWRCSGCGKYYLDASAANETTAEKTILPALGHNYVNGTCTRCSAKDPSAAEPDPNAAVVSVVPVRGKAGQTVEVTVTLENNPGFSDLSLEIGYDADVIELTKVTPNSAVGCIFTTSQQLTQLPYRLNWVNGTEDSTFTGTLVTLTFQIKDSAELGSYPVTVSYYKGKYGNNIDGEDVNYNQNGSRVPIIYVNGSVTVYSYTPGDLNGDGRINSKDAIYLLRYIAGWELDGLVEDALDVNGDGKINSKDAVHLLRYIAGWDVTLH